MTAAWLAGIVATSAVGSVHCLAMCGPLAGMHGGAKSLRLAFVHALGRMATYVVLGAVAGAVGSALDVAGALGDVQRLAAVVAAVAVVVIGVKTSTSTSASTSTRSAFSRALVKIGTRRPARRAWWFGVMTGLIPCGWLWAFVATAGGTGGAMSGAVVMFAFWLGTVPAMVGLLGFAGPALARIRARMPVVTAAAMIALGLGTLAMRWHDAGRAQVLAPHCPHCHGGAS